IPKSLTVRHEWLNRIGASNTANGRICSKHFDESDFELKSDGCRWLKPDALPTEVVEEFEDEANEIEVAVAHCVYDEVRPALNIVYKEHHYSKAAKIANKRNGKSLAGYGLKAFVKACARSTKACGKRA
ncbi:hypothetical protein Bhyg_07833, partial [Pseudolycoriella hygida]